MRIKTKISKKLVLRLALFAAIIGAAFFFDYYFDSNSSELNKTVSQNEKQESQTTSHCYFVVQTASINAKSSIQKTFPRKIQLKSQDKLIQKYHQLRNFQVLKAEVETQTSPLISTYHYLVFQNYFFTESDDEPLIS